MQGYHNITRLQVGDKTETLERFTEVDIERAELEAFAAAVEGKNPYPIPVSEAIHGTAVLEAIVSSAKTGKNVRVST